MSDTTKLILAIVVAVIVVAVIIGFVVNARKRREMEHRRFEAGELRAKIEQQAPVLRENDDRASVTSEIAASARSEADVAAEAAERKAQEARALEEQAAHKDEEARRLEKHAEGHASAAEEARTSAAALALEADRLDPDVRTDDEGNRLDAVDEASKEPASEDSASAPFLRDDDEPDLADAENPFAQESPETAMSSSEEGMGTKESFDHPTDESRDDVSNDDTTRPDTTSADGSPSHTSASSDHAAHTDHADHAADAADSAPLAGMHDTAGDRTSDRVSGSRDDEQRVSVPALDDRDEFVTGTGTPADDPGDHRGQPWATTTGEQPPGSDTEEGADTHSEPSDGGQQAVGPSGSGEYASDQTAADDFSSSTGSSTGSDDTAQHDHSDHEGHDHSDHEGHDHSDHEGHDHSDHEGHDHSDHEGHDHSDHDHSDHEGHDHSEGSPDGQGSQGSAGRRISDFEEVSDGGYGVGSAAALGDGAQPFGHEIKASRDSGTFLAPGDEGYDHHEPDVWFYDEESARRSGFRKSGE